MTDINKDKVWVPKPKEKCWAILFDRYFFDVGWNYFDKIGDGDKLYDLGRLFPYNKEKEARVRCQEMNDAIRKKENKF